MQSWQRQSRLLDRGEVDGPEGISLDMNRDAVVVVPLNGVRGEGVALWHGSDAGEVARLAQRLEESGPRERDGVVRVSDVVVVGGRRLPRSNRCGIEAKEVTVVTAGCDVPGARLDSAELVVGVDVDGVEGVLVAWWRQWT